MSFTMAQKILFKHCDPAGIVFYPRYFEIINDCTEAFFDTGLGHPFETLHLTGGVPTARIDTEFKAPSRHGDVLQIELRCTRLGRASLGLKFTGNCGQEARFEAESVLVYVDSSGKPHSWPPALRTALQAEIEGDS